MYMTPAAGFSGRAYWNQPGINLYKGLNRAFYKHPTLSTCLSTNLPLDQLCT